MSNIFPWSSYQNIDYLSTLAKTVSMLAPVYQRGLRERRRKVYAWENAAIKRMGDYDRRRKRSLKMKKKYYAKTKEKYKKDRRMAAALNKNGGEISFK